MSLDCIKRTYRPDRPDTRLHTTYGSMSEWLRGPPGTWAGRPSLPAAILAQNSSSPQFTRKKCQRGKKEYIYMRNSHLPSDPRFNPMRDATDEETPVHARFSTNCGYDDFHKAYRTARTVGPQHEFPLWGPPRLRHGRLGGSWRHVKEVLQAGGKRIVFVDGQVSTRDAQDIDGVPGGHLILGKSKGPKPIRDLDKLLDVQESPRILPRAQKAPYVTLTAQKGFEMNNWSLIR